MATINQVISTIPDAGHRGVDARTLFVTKQEAFQDAITDAFVPQLNTFRVEANLLASEVNSLRNATLALRNETENIRNLANTQTQAQVALATTQAGITTTKASEATASANQALTYKNQLQGYVVPAGASYSVDQINTQNSAMTKAQFNALAEERKANRAGSGFEEWGLMSTQFSNINEGMWCPSTSVFFLGMSNTTSSRGISKTINPVLNIDGSRLALRNTNNSNAANVVNLPTAPNIYPYDTVLTVEQIASGVIKHADASNSGLIVNGKFDVDASGWTLLNGASFSSNSLSFTTTTSSAQQVNNNMTIGKQYVVEFNVSSYTSGTQVWVRVGGSTYSVIRVTGTGRLQTTITATNSSETVSIYSGGFFIGSIDNIAVYPADAISRSDLVFLESFHEDISEKNFVYPLGNVQYLGANTDGLTGIANGAFTGFEQYSLFGNWQTPSALIGKGYIWSSLTEAQKKAFIANPDNNCYLDGDKVIQVRYRVRVVQGWGDTWSNVDTQMPSASGYMQSGNITNGGVYVYPKGKKTSILYDQGGETTTYGVYGTKYTAWTSSLTWNDNGVFTASSSTGSTTGFTTGSYDGKCYALPIALVHRRNQGMYHPVYNPNGTKKASDDNFWYNTAASFTSISDCFDPAKLLTVSGRPDGLFYDQVHEGDILDLRNSSKKVEDYNRLISREFNKLVAGSTRGKEGEISIVAGKATQYYKHTATKIRFFLGSGATSGTTLPTNTGLYSKKTHKILVVNKDNGTYCIGDIDQYNSSAGEIEVGYLYTPFNTLSGALTTYITPTNGLDVYIIGESTRTKSNTLLHCDILGNPTNYPTAWKQSGVFGTPLIVAEDGTSLLPDGVRDTFKLSRKANATPLLCLRSIDNGVTWTSFTPTFSTTTNEITLTNEPAGNLVMVYYQTHTNMAVPVVNSEVLEYGKVLGTDGLSNAHFISTLIGKVPTANTAPYLQDGYNVNAYRIDMSTFKWSTTSTEVPTHSALSLAGGASGVPAAKVLPYLTRTNRKAYLNLVFKEMKHNGTSWGDSNTFNIVDNVSTTADNNAQTVLIGQKTVELPYFIAGDE